MTDYDLMTFAKYKWEGYRKTVTEISAEQNGNNSLVQSDVVLYCFDDVINDLYKKHKKPASVDGIAFTDKKIHLFEFKSGFRDKIDIHRLDPEKGKCKEAKKVCTDYWNLFDKNRKNEKKILRDSIQQKTVETYIALEKDLFPICTRMKDKSFDLILWIVIDASPDEQILAIQKDAAKDRTGEADNNVNDEHERINESMKKFCKRIDGNGHDYYYDEIKVVPVSVFNRIISNLDFVG